MTVGDGRGGPIAGVLRLHTNPKRQRGLASREASVAAGPTGGAVAAYCMLEPQNILDRPSATCKLPSNRIG